MPDHNERLMAANASAFVAGYMSGFGNEFATEAVAGALPAGCNSPQRAPHGLFAEQFSTTAFTVPRSNARRTWFYRIRPSAAQGKFERLAHSGIDAGYAPPSPNRIRWDPQPSRAGLDFIDSLLPLAATPGAPGTGVSAWRYCADRPMERTFYTADGELLFVPFEGKASIFTECGKLEIAPGEICVVPRGMKFRLTPLDGRASGYLCENHGEAFRLPDLGPIGSNCLANPRDFLTPVAAFEDVEGPHTLVAKHSGSLWQAPLGHGPLDVVAWHGNSVPYKYDLFRFNAIGTISYDHPDPSIYTVLSSPSPVPGVANMDFVIFPPRWLVAENTFRPPWYHRNLMSELMGLVVGVYDAKADGFVPGGASLHSRFSAHGPDAATTDRAENAVLAPHKLEGTMAFMFETHDVFRASVHPEVALTEQADYDSCWDGIAARFGREAGQ
ncbi:homogentisate 1,2-dioxygenase [Novosphingobium sp. MMS21-SN21R]|uniref:homogentisate 1,2-dioxygenase n=1 Tax=Novosphingobium sp. MMS21-SN21R TaxID=2969298 RepID=UPI002884772C|nr:homogentisate 1,2-dioxygenase [Novosphingobium sp. MMS21-SN21R]MDT0510248.1 homogentisate 1,2-dioxygenase [Novosphingobium sp. MMS21-SN21R]